MTDKNLALLGAGLTITGVFCPIVTFPLFGAQNYLQNGRGDGTIILALGGISLLLIIAQKFKALFFSGGLSLLISVYTLLALVSRLNSLRTSMISGPKSDPFSSYGMVIMQSVQIDWGWVPLIGGASFMIFGAWRAVRKQQTDVISSEISASGSDVSF